MEQISLYIPIELFGVKTYPTKSARNLGVIFDKNVNFRSHISAICSACFYYIRDLRRIRRYLDLNSATLLANALVSSRLDDCNSLLSGITDTDLVKLQRVQDRLAHVVTKSLPFTRSVPLLRSLHRLPVKFRVDFKICLLTKRKQYRMISIPANYLQHWLCLTFPLPAIRLTILSS